MQFVPARKLAPKPRDLELERVTDDLAALVREDIALAMDVIPAQGSLAFRDGQGKVWVVTIQASDVAELRCEYDLRTQNEIQQAVATRAELRRPSAAPRRRRRKA